MIYRILYNHQEIYGPDLDMAVLNPTLEVELNAAGKLEFTLPITREGGEDPIWNNIQVFQGEVEVYEGDDCIWFGRPLQIIRDWNNHKRVLCEGALAYFNDTVQRTKEYKQNEQGVKDTPLYTGEPYTASKYKKGFFNALIDNHNSQVQKESGTSTPDTNRLIEVGTVDVDNELVWRKTDYETTAECLQSMCLDTNGGYFILRKEKVPGTISDYVSKIDWRKEMPYGTDQPVAFGLNLLDISQDLNGADLCTVLIPTGEDDMNLIEYRTVDENDERYRGCTHVKGDDYIVHTAGFAKYGKILKQKTFNGSSDEIATRGDLFNKATDWLNEQNTDETTIECSAADLHYLNEYSDYGKLRIGQMVTVVDSVHNVNRTLPIFKVSMNLDSGVKQITMGTPPKKELTDIVKPKTSSSTRGSNGGSADSTGDSGGSGGSGGGSVSVPVKDVQTKVPGGSYHSVVEKKKAKIDLSGYVSDITMDGGDSIVDRQTGKANIQVPVKGVEVDNTSIVDANGIAKINSNNFGKVDDVRVDGNSVVTNKIANLNSNNFGKVDDVQVNGTSIVDANKIAKITGYVDGYQVTFKYDHHIYYWKYTPPVGGGSGTWSIQDSDISTDTIKAVYNSDNKSLRFDLNDWFQRKVTWGGGIYQYFDNLGPDPAYHDPDDKVDGNYIIRTTFPFGAFYVNDTQLDLTSLSLNNNNNDERFSLNFINGGGIKVETSRHYDINGEGFNIKLSTIKEANKPHLETVFSDDTMFGEGASSDAVSYYVQHDGVYLISIITSESNSSDILFEDSSGSPISPTTIITDIGTVLDTNVYAVTKLCQLSMGTIVKFTRQKSGSYLDGDTCLRTITELKNIDVSNASRIEYKSAKNILQVTSSQTTVRGGDSIVNSHSNGAIGIFSTIAYDADNAPPQALSFCAFEPSASVNRSGSISDPYAVATYKGKVVGSIGDNDRCRARTIVAYDNGPTDSQINSTITLSDLVDYSYYGGNSKGYFYCYGLIISASKYSEGDEGYVTETEMEDAISDAVSTLESNFQDGVDAIYDACVAKGSTPASQSLSDVVQGIMDIPQGGGGGGDYIQYNPFPSGATTLTLYDDSNNNVDVQSSSIDNDGTADAVLLKWSNGMGFVIRLNTNPDGMYKVEFDYQTTDCIFKQDYRLGYLFENDPRTNYYGDYTSWNDNIERNNNLQHHSVTLNTTGNYAYLNFNLTGIDTDGSGHLITISDLKVYKYVKKGAIDFYSDTGTFTIDEVEAISTYTITNLRFMSEAGGA